MGGKHKIPRRGLQTHAEDFEKFERIVKVLRDKTGVKDLTYRQAFNLVVEAAEKKINAPDPI